MLLPIILIATVWCVLSESVLLLDWAMGLVLGAITWVASRKLLSAPHSNMRLRPLPLIRFLFVAFFGMFPAAVRLAPLVIQGQAHASESVIAGRRRHHEQLAFAASSRSRVCFLWCRSGILLYRRRGAVPVQTILHPSVGLFGNRHGGALAAAGWRHDPAGMGTRHAENGTDAADLPAHSSAGDHGTGPMQAGTGRIEDFNGNPFSHHETVLRKKKHHSQKEVPT